VVNELQLRYVLGEFELEPETHRLLKSGEQIHLSNKPFKVLTFLIEHRNRIVSREELLEHFWDGHDVYEETLTRCIATIRKALSDSTDIPRFIETKWAEGYRFVHPVEEVASDFEIERTRAIKIVVEEESETQALPSRTVFSWNRAKTIAALAVVAFVAIGAGMWYRSSTRTADVRSVAVIPLRNLTGNDENTYICDGISESVLTALSQYSDLKVIARGSSFRFEDDADPIEIGKALNVESVLVGAVRRTNETFRISARLLSTADGSVIWAGETTDRPASEMLTLQHEIARTVSNGLRRRAGGSSEHIRPTDNLDAYQNYLKGRYYWNLRTIESLRKSLEFYGRAAEIDAGFSLAYSGMADSYQLLAEYRGMKSGEAFSRARRAAEKAIELDNNSAEAHNALAYTLAFYDWKWEPAEREFLRAIELNPNYASAHQWYSELLTTLGRFDEAEREAKIALESDPLSLVIQIDVASVYYMTRRYDKTIELVNGVLKTDPKWVWGHIYHWVVYEQMGLEAESVAAWANAVEYGWGGKDADELRAAYAAGGKHAFWTTYLQQSESPQNARTHLAWDRILCYLRLGDRDKTFEWLERSYAERDRWIMNIRFDPQFDSIRSDPRYPELLRRIGLEP
jgi:TolB-like protein/DNA-binding winged helix-turn-helix (wHTH) protein